MLIEQNTNYADKLKHIGHPTFDKVRNLSVRFYRELPKKLQDKLFDVLHRGVEILDSEPQMTTYLYTYGKMHQAKLKYAFEHLPEEFLMLPKINIIDYGCGQAVGTMCYADYLHSNGYAQQIKTITLIEPSKICLKRASLHASVFFPAAEIRTLLTTFDWLDEEDMSTDEYFFDKIPTLHILSNVLDILDFDLENFSNIVKQSLEGYNQFVCVGPYFFDMERDGRMDVFQEQIEGDVNFSGTMDQYKLTPNNAWTCKVKVFSRGNLLQYFTRPTEADLDEAIKDEFGSLYSKDGKRLFSFRHNEKGFGIVKQGTEVICREAFKYECSSLQQIALPDTVKYIGDYAFDGCGSLQQIVLPDTVKYIGAWAFQGCISLQQVTIPNSVTVIDNFAFEGCTSLQQIIIPDSVTSIGFSAFEGCTSLQQVVFPESVTEISSSAFKECGSLQQVIISDSVISIGERVFEGCDSLKQVAVFNSETSMDKNLFRESQFQQFDDSDSVTTIGKFAFEGCTSLQQVTIPDSVQSIGAWAFSGCNSLEQIIIPNSVKYIDYRAFGECSSLQQVTIPDSVTSIGKLAFGGCPSLQQVTIPDSVTVIGDYSFQGCSSLQQVTIPNSVTSIGDWAFDGCSSLQQVTIPDSVTVIGDYAFQGCTSLQQVTIPDSVTSIGDCAFSQCGSLQKVIIPNSVTSIGCLAFQACKSLKHIHLQESISYINDNLLGCSGDITLTSDSNYYIAKDCFLIHNGFIKKSLISYWGKERNVTIPDSVTRIAAFAFQGSGSLQQITIPNSVTLIDYSAFGGCNSLKQITIPNSVTYIGSNAFYGCSSLQQITLPGYAFWGGLSRKHIPRM